MSGGATPSATASRASSAMASTIRSRIAVGARRSSGARRRRWPRLADPALTGISVEPGARLAAEVAGFDEPLLDRRRAQPLGTPEAVPDPGRCREADVDPGQVHQLERTHREAVRAERLVDLGDTRGAGLEDAECLDGERPVDPVDDEARPVGAHHRGLAPGAHDRHGAGDDRRVGQRRCDHLDERHERRGVEEMQADDAARTGRRLGDLGDREGARVGGQDHLGLGDVIERPEDRPLQLQVLQGALDHEVGVVDQPVEGRHVSQPVQPGGDPGVGPVRIEAELRRPSRQAVADPLAPALEGRRRRRHRGRPRSPPRGRPARSPRPSSRLRRCRR